MSLQVETQVNETSMKPEKLNTKDLVYLSLQQPLSQKNDGKTELESEIEEEFSLKGNRILLNLLTLV